MNKVTIGATVLAVTALIVATTAWSARRPNAEMSLPAKVAPQPFAPLFETPPAMSVARPFAYGSGVNYGLGNSNSAVTPPVVTSPIIAPTFQDEVVSARLSVLPSAREAALWQEPLSAGERAPDFVLPDQRGRFHRLSDLRGKTVVLSFYPQDFTFTCAGIAVDFDREAPAFETRGAVVFSVSVQPVSSKIAFAGRFGIKHPLLADFDKQAARAYRVLNRDGLAARVTFLIGPDGRILKTSQHIRPQTHVRDMLAQMDELNASRAAFSNLYSTRNTKAIGAPSRLSSSVLVMR